MQPLNFIKRTVGVAMAMACLGGSGGAAQAADAVVYTSNNVQTVDVAVDIIKRRAPGLTVQKVASGTGALMKRIEAESANPLGDVVWGAGFDTLAAFKQNFQPYKSPEAKGLDAALIGTGDLWAASNLHVMVVMVNDKQLKGNPMPKTWADLANPIWKGKIVMGDPVSSGSAYGQVYGLYKLLGEDGLKKLAANVVVSKSSAQVYRGVADGEYPLGVTMEYAAYSYVAGGQKDVKLVYPADGTFVQPEAVAIIKNPKNGAQAAQQLYDQLLSREVQEAELVENFRRPSRADIDVAKLTKLPNLKDIKVYPTDPLAGAADYDKVIKLWESTIKQGGK